MATPGTIWNEADLNTLGGQAAGAPVAPAAKTTQRVDMAPTAAIAPDPAPKPKHKPHKTKSKDIDNSQ